MRGMDRRPCLPRETDAPTRSRRRQRRVLRATRGPPFLRPRGRLFSLIYLRDILRGLPHWPRDRYLELAPKFWTATRARLDPTQLATDLGPLTVPSRPEQEELPRP